MVVLMGQGVLRPSSLLHRPQPSTHIAASCHLRCREIRAQDSLQERGTAARSANGQDASTSSRSTAGNTWCSMHEEEVFSRLSVRLREAGVFERLTKSGLPIH